MNNFDELLSALIKAKKDNPNISQAELIRLVMPELTQEQQQRIETKSASAYAILQANHESQKDLAQAKKDGHSREYWIQQQVESITEGRTEEEKELLLKSVSKALNNVIANQIVEE